MHTSPANSASLIMSWGWGSVIWNFSVAHSSPMERHNNPHPHPCLHPNLYKMEKRVGNLQDSLLCVGCNVCSDGNIAIPEKRGSRGHFPSPVSIKIAMACKEIWAFDFQIGQVLGQGAHFLVSVFGKEVMAEEKAWRWSCCCPCLAWQDTVGFCSWGDPGEQCLTCASYLPHTIWELPAGQGKPSHSRLGSAPTWQEMMGQEVKWVKECSHPRMSTRIHPRESWLLSTCHVYG